MANLLPVAFRGDTLYLVEIDGEPFTPARPICEAIGVTWPAQYQKLISGEHRWGGVMIETPTAGGEQQALCIPVRKLSGWLASINAGKVKPELREKIEAYQEECDDALWRYWSQGHSSRNEPPAESPTPARPRTAEIPRLWLGTFQGERVTIAREQLECAAGILAGVEFAKDPQTRRDLLTAAHTQTQTQTQVAYYFISEQYKLDNGHA